MVFRISVALYIVSEIVICVGDILWMN